MAREPSRLIFEQFPRVAGTDPAPGVRPTFEMLNLIEATGPYEFAPHQHQHYEVIAIDRGDYLCAVNDEPVRLAAGQILVVKPGDWHRETFAPPLRYRCLRFSLEGGGGERSVSLFSARARAAQQCIDDRERAVLWPLLDRIQGESTIDDPFAAQVQDALLLEFFWRMVRALPRSAVASPFLRESGDLGFGQRLARLFQEHLRGGIGIEAMAAAMGLSRAALTGKCRELLGATPAKAFVRWKMQRALSMLQQSDASVKDIAETLGFENQFHFSRVFKKCYGKPPSRFR